MGTIKPRYHLSQKILGELYRSIDENKIWKEDISRTADWQKSDIWPELIELVESRIRSTDYKIMPRRRYEQAWRIRGQ